MKALERIKNHGKGIVKASKVLKRIGNHRQALQSTEKALRDQRKSTEEHWKSIEKRIVQVLRSPKKH